MTKAKTKAKAKATGKATKNSVAATTDLDKSPDTEMALMVKGGHGTSMVISEQFRKG